MSVRTKLILIFLGLSVLPLAALTFISYSNSIRSVRKLVERDNTEAAADLRRRVSLLDRELNRKVADVTELPELQALDPRRALSPAEVSKLAQAMQSKVQDRWSLFSDMEFVPRAPIAEPTPPTPTSRPAPPDPRPVASPEALKKTIGAIFSGSEDPEEEGKEETGDEEVYSVKVFLPDFAGNSEKSPKVREYQLDFKDGAPTEETIQVMAEGMVENLVRLPGFVLQSGESGIKLRNLGRDLQQEFSRALPGLEAELEALAEASEGVGDMPDLLAPEAPEPGSDAHRATFLERLDQAAARSSQTIELPVRGAAGNVGRIIARVRPDRMVSEVFNGMALKENEIAFAIDSQGRLHARSDGHLGQLQALGLADKGGQWNATGFTSARATVANGEALRDALAGHPDWVAVAEDNRDTGYTFGVVRKVSTELGSIRRAALLNLFLGFTFIGLAGSGIIVFSRRMTRGLEDLTDGARRLAAGDLAHRIEARRRDEIGQLAGAFNEMAGDLEVSRRRLVTQERVRRELEIAREIQRDSLPRSGLSCGDVEIVGRSIPSNEVGGDFFNFMRLDDDRQAMLVGDVSGKGVPAALMMAEVQATLRTLLEYHRDVSEIARRLNREVALTKPDNVYFTVFIGILDRRAEKLTYVNAGQSPPFVICGASGKIRELPSNARPLGLFEDSEMCVAEIDIGPGDLLCIYTDGVVESASRTDQEEFFGRDRLEKVVRESFDSSLEGLLDQVGKSLTGFHGDPALEDDATMVLLRVAAESPATRRDQGEAVMAVAPS